MKLLFDCLCFGILVNFGATVVGGTITISTTSLVSSPSDTNSQSTQPPTPSPTLPDKTPASSSLPSEKTSTLKISQNTSKSVITTPPFVSPSSPNTLSPINTNTSSVSLPSSNTPTDYFSPTTPMPSPTSQDKTPASSNLPSEKSSTLKISQNTSKSVTTTPPSTSPSSSNTLSPINTNTSSVSLPSSNTITYGFPPTTSPPSPTSPNNIQATTSATATFDSPTSTKSSCPSPCTPASYLPTTTPFASSVGPTSSLTRPSTDPQVGSVSTRTNILASSSRSGNPPIYVPPEVLEFTGKITFSHKQRKIVKRSIIDISYGIEKILNDIYNNTTGFLYSKVLGLTKKEPNLLECTFKLFFNETTDETSSSLKEKLFMYNGTHGFGKYTLRSVGDIVKVVDDVKSSSKSQDKSLKIWVIAVIAGLGAFCLILIIILICQRKFIENLEKEKRASSRSSDRGFNNYPAVFDGIDDGRNIPLQLSTSPLLSTTDAESPLLRDLVDGTKESSLSENLNQNGKTTEKNSEENTPAREKSDNNIDQLTIIQTNNEGSSKLSTFGRQQREVDDGSPENKTTAAKQIEQTTSSEKPDKTVNELAKIEAEKKDASKLSTFGSKDLKVDKSLENTANDEEKTPVASEKPKDTSPVDKLNVPDETKTEDSSKSSHASEESVNKTSEGKQTEESQKQKEYAAATSKV